MNLSDVEKDLPNGLHDAVLRKYVVDYENRSAKLYFDVWVGDLDSKVEEVREEYRPGVLHLHGLEYWAVDPPSSELKHSFGPYASDTGDIESIKTDTTSSLPEAKPGTFRAYFFLYAIESFIYLSAAGAEFEFDT